MIPSAGRASGLPRADLKTMGPDVEPAKRDDADERRAERRQVWTGAALIVVSLLLHVGVLIALVLAPDRTPAPVTEAIPVEVVASVPKPEAPRPAANAAPTSTATPAAEPPAQPAPTQPQPPPPAAREAQPTQGPPPPPAQKGAVGRFDGMPPSFRAVTLPPTALGGTEAANYKAIVFGLLTAAKRYPDAARARGAGGTAVVAFSVDATGHVQRATIAQSSGAGDLDAETLDMVHRCDPFPPPPQGAQTSFAAGIEFGSEQ